MNKWGVEDWKNHVQNMGPLLLEGYGLRVKVNQFFLCTRVEPSGMGCMSDYDNNHSPQWRYQLFDEGVLRWIDGDELCEYLADGAEIII